jgi:quercetin dioxygenase-like cupin family protein
MLILERAQQEWRDSGVSGIEKCELRRNDANGGVGLVRFAKGAIFPLHDHPGWEDVLILRGSVLIGGTRLDEGDYAYTSAGETHDLVALEDALVYVSSEKGIKIIRNA